MLPTDELLPRSCADASHGMGTVGAETGTDWHPWTQGEPLDLVPRVTEVTVPKLSAAGSDGSVHPLLPACREPGI